MPTVDFLRISIFDIMAASDSESSMDLEEAKAILARKRKKTSADGEDASQEPPDTDSDSTADPDEILEILAAKNKLTKKVICRIKDLARMKKKKVDAVPSSSSDEEEVKGITTSDTENEQNSRATKKKPARPKARKQRPKKTHTMSDSSDDSDSQSTPEIPTPTKARTSAANNQRPCKYGNKCYRKNPEHFQEFSHKRANNEKSKASTSGIQSKKTKMNGTTKKPSSSPMKKFGFFFTSVEGIPQKYNDALAYSIKDLLSLTKGPLKASAQFNYMFDIPWLIEQYPAQFRKCPLTIVHGEKQKAKESLENSGSLYPNIKFCQAKLDIPFGTHHTKMMFLLYEDGLRIIIHTSNMVSSDWAKKTQGMWVSPLFPRLEGEPSLTEGESVTRFKADIVEYVSSYGAEKLEAWCTILKQHDLSGANVFIIASVPGRHVGSKKTAFGHLKLRKVLHKHGPSSDTVTDLWPVIGQFSSIGSLGASADLWMCKEWIASLGMVKEKNTATRTSPLKLVYPSVENVRLSLEGYPAGASLPYSIKVASKQTYLKDFLHHWKSEYFGRSEASPHVKSYMRLSPSSQKMAWFLVSSANLSKAAWGCLEKSDSQFMIRSYEIGVLFLPDYFDLELFDVPSQEKGEDFIPFPVPFDLPLSKYGAKDEPWIWDIPHVYGPDRNGNKWCPP